MLIKRQVFLKAFSCNLYISLIKFEKDEETDERYITLARTKHLYIEKGLFHLKKAFYILWYQLESNQRHKDFQSFALPTELWYPLLGVANVVCFFTFESFFSNFI
jgi:hypothetical protein